MFNLLKSMKPCAIKGDFIACYITHIFPKHSLKFGCILKKNIFVLNIITLRNLKVNNLESIYILNTWDAIENYLSKGSLTIIKKDIMALHKNTTFSHAVL
jgi:hypothetical protein